MAGAGNIGRLWVTVDADIKQFEAKIRKVEERLKSAANLANGEAKKMAGAFDGAASGANKASRAVDQTAAAAKRAQRPTTALNYTMLRLSQAFVNLRYGNPIGVIAGLSQAAASASRGFAGLSASAGGFGNLLGKIIASAKGFALAAAGVVAGLAAITVAISALTIAGGALIAKIGIKAAADLETLKIQYEAMLGSAKAAQDEVNFLLELGKTSVVPTEQLLEANRQLLAYGITNQTLRRDLIQFMSDYGSAAGLTAAQVGNLSYAIGQISAQGRALTQDVRQLSNASIGVDKLAEAIGVTVEEFNEMTADGQMTADVILPAIIAQAENLGPAAEKARESFNGILNNLADIAKINIASAFEEVLDKVRPAIKWVEKFIAAFDFRPIADAISQTMQFFSDTVFNNVVDAADSGKQFAETFGQAIAIAGQVMAGFTNVVRIAVSTSMLMLNTLAAVFAAGMSGVLKLVGNALKIAGNIAAVLPSMGDTAAQLQSLGDAALNFDSSVEGFIGDSFDRIGNSAAGASDAVGDLWKTIREFDVNIKRSARGSGSSAGEFFATPDGNGDGDGDGDGKDGKNDNPLFKLYAEWLKQFQKLRDEFAKARTSLTTIVSGRFGLESELSKALTFGDATTNFQADSEKIISTFDKTAKAVSDYYNAVGGGENRIFGAKAFREARKKKNATIGALRAQTEELVALSESNKKLQAELTEYRSNRLKQLEVDLNRTEKVYQGYIGADGYLVKGQIQIANEALEAATRAYEQANAKLQDMIAERDQFLKGIRDSARSFVNSLSVQSDMVEEFRRLDDIGSFALTEKKKSESLKDQMRARLETLKEWAKNVKLLREKGLNSDLLRDLISAGPEASGEAVAELANSGQDSINEVNAIQSELASVTSGIQDTANSAFFATAINAQQNLVNSLAAQKAAAEAAALAAEAEYNRIKMELEATQKAVEEGTDAHSQELKSQMEANAKAAADITAEITESLKWLTDKKNPFSAKKMGKSVINGLIKGLEAKEPALIKKARDIANAVSRTIAASLQINSPSKLMEQYGRWVGEGLAIGMDDSMAQVEAASFRMSRVSVPGGVGGDSAAPTVKVYIGDTELRDIVDVQVESASAKDLDTVLSGRRL